MFTFICFILAGICFLVAAAQTCLKPITLDLVALGLFFAVLPFVVSQYSAI